MLRSRTNITSSPGANANANAGEKNSNKNPRGSLRTTKAGQRRNRHNIYSPHRLICMLLTLILICVLIILTPTKYEDETSSKDHSKKNLRNNIRRKMNRIHQHHVNMNKKTQNHPKHYENSQHRDHHKSSTSSSSIYNNDLQYPSIDGTMISLSKFMGNIAIIINVASE